MNRFAKENAEKCSVFHVLFKHLLNYYICNVTIILHTAVKVIKQDVCI